MKKIISLSLAALMLVLLLITATSCGMEGITGYTRLRDHVVNTAGPNNELSLVGAPGSFYTVKLIAPVQEGGASIDEVRLIARDSNKTLTLKLTGSTEKAALTYSYAGACAEATVLLTHYTGNELIEFISVSNIRPEDEQKYREDATSMLNNALQSLDVYTTEHLGMDMQELGFIALSDKYMAPTEEVEIEEDLGGAFSPARLQKAGLMIIQGMGMVFLVLAILWLVLLIFKKVFYKDPNAAKKAAEPAPASTPAPVASAPANDDALVAAITAAVATYIESDPALSSQFAGGFRVVSFKKKNGKTSWNH